MPALIWAWREGIWPWPACRTWPITTCCDLVGLDVGALERRRDRDAAELGGVEGGQAAAQLADGRAGGAEDHGLGHAPRLVRSRAPMRRPPPPPTPPPTPAPTRSPSASSRTRAIAHDLDGGALRRAARRRRGAARLQQARGHARRRAGAGSSPGSARATSFDAERARVAAAAVARPRAASSARASLCWELPHHVADAHAGALVEGTLLAAYRSTRYKTRAPTRTTPRELDELIVSAHHDVADAVERGARRRPRRANAARDLQNPPANDLTPTRAGRARARARRARRSTVEVDGPRARSRRPGMGAFAGRRPGHRRGAAADHAALRRPRRDGPAARLRRQGGDVRHRRHLDQARGEDARDEVRHVGRRRRARGRCGAIAAARAAGARGRASIGATENMPSGHAMKPGDIVRAMHRHDDRGQQHRRRGPARARRLPRPRGRAGRRAARRPRHADRRDRHRARLDLRRACSATDDEWCDAVAAAGAARRRARRGGCRCTPSTTS